MSTLTADSAKSLVQLLLPQIEANHRLARMVVQALANDKLDVRPVADGESLGDMAWYVASAAAVGLAGIAEGRFPAPPAKPQPATVEAFLAWDDDQFPMALQRLVSLDGEALLRPMTFGHLTTSAAEFVPLLLSNLAQHTGALMACIAQCGASRQVAAPAAEDGELSEAQLAQVAGGAVLTAHMQTTSTTPNGILITGNYGTPSPIVQTQLTQAGLGSLLGDGGGGYGAVGAVGGLAAWAGVFGAAFVSALGVNAALNTGATVGAILLGVLSRF
jgi:hypothetical protein